MADTATHPQTSHSDADESAPSRRHPIARGMVVALLWIILTLASLWCVAALYYDVRVPGLRAPLAILYAVAMLAAVAAGRHTVSSAMSAMSRLAEEIAPQGGEIAAFHAKKRQVFALMQQTERRIRTAMNA